MYIYHHITLFIYHINTYDIHLVQECVEEMLKMDVNDLFRNSKAIYCYTSRVFYCKEVAYGQYKCYGHVSRRCSNYIFILDVTPGFNGLGKDNCKSRRETLSFGIWWDLY